MTEQAVANPLTPEQQALLDIWQQHVVAEFVMPNPEAALATMTEDAYVLNIPAYTGGFGKEGVREFYTNYFIPNIPKDLEMIPLSQTIGKDRIIEESVARLTHNTRLDWLLPGLEPTGKQLEFALVAVISFRDGKIASEHLYWDGGGVLAQLGLVKEEGLSIVGGPESARALLNPGPHLNNSLRGR